MYTCPYVPFPTNSTTSKMPAGSCKRKGKNRTLKAYATFEDIRKMQVSDVQKYIFNLVFQTEYKQQLKRIVMLAVDFRGIKWRKLINIYLFIF